MQSAAVTTATRFVTAESKHPYPHPTIRAIVPKSLSPG
jgi:hypothetical protein